MNTIKPLPLAQDIESTAVLKKLAKAHLNDTLYVLLQNVSAKPEAPI